MDIARLENDDEYGHHDGEQRNTFDERSQDDRPTANVLGGFRLTGDAFVGRSADPADAEARTDSDDASTDTRAELGDVHDLSSLGRVFEEEHVLFCFLCAP